MPVHTPLTAKLSLVTFVSRTWDSPRLSEQFTKTQRVFGAVPMSVCDAGYKYGPFGVDNENVEVWNFYCDTNGKIPKQFYIEVILRFF
jgi:hypothetical protein